MAVANERANELTFVSKLFQGFCLGLTLGMVCTHVFFKHNNNVSLNNGVRSLREVKFDNKDGGDHYDFEVHGHNLPNKSKSPTNWRINSNVDFNRDMDDDHHKQSKNITFKVKVLCWIVTSPKSTERKGKTVKETWGKRCDKLLFMSSKEDKRFPAVGLDLPEGHKNLWYKTRAAWQYVYDHHLNDADWFLKADDDTFIIVENLKYLCSKFNPSNPHYLGRYFRKYGGFNSGKAGYVFSRETLKQFANVMKDPTKCRASASSSEDVEVGRCLANIGVFPGDSRDSRKRETFHPFPPAYHLIPGFYNSYLWIYDFNNYPVQSGQKCCSEISISFHFVDDSESHMMYLMEYFANHLLPYYGNNNNWNF